MLLIVFEVSDLFLDIPLKAKNWNTFVSVELCLCYIDLMVV
jgi:hypothetical protein